MPVADAALVLMCTLVVPLCNSTVIAWREGAHHHDKRSESTCSRAPARASAATHVNTWPACDSLPALRRSTSAYDREA